MAQATFLGPYNVQDYLFNSDESGINIAILNNAYTTLKPGPAGLGISSARPSGKTTASKLSTIALALDKMLVEKSVTALDGITRPAVYCEYKSKDGHLVGCMATNEDAAHPEEMTLTLLDKVEPKGYEALIPILAYALSEANTDKKSDELKDLFATIAEQYKNNGKAEFKEVLKFCDCFLWSFGQKVKTFKIFFDLVPQVIQQGYAGASRIFEVADFVDLIDGAPRLEILAKAGIETRSKNKNGKKSSGSSIMDECMNGDHFVKYKWSEAQALKIPTKASLEQFIPSTHFYSMLKKIEHRFGKVLERMDSGLTGLDALGSDYINSFFIGKPGTGKTTIGYALGAALGMPVYSIPITKNTEEDTFQGMTKVIDGGFKYVPTEFLEAYTHGGIVLLEEVNLADPSVIMGALGQAIEAPFVLMEDGYKPVRRHPLCVIIGTMNIGTYGAKGVSQAFSSRFKQTYILDDPKEEDFIKILEKSGQKEKACKWVYKAYEKINNYLKSPEISREEICLNVTLRGCIGALDCMTEGDTPHIIIQRRRKYNYGAFSI